MTPHNRRATATSIHWMTPPRRAAYYIDDRAITFKGDWPDVVRQVEEGR